MSCSTVPCHCSLQLPVHGLYSVEAELNTAGHLRLTCSYRMTAERSGDDNHGREHVSLNQHLALSSCAPSSWYRLRQTDRGSWTLPGGCGERRVARLLQMQLPTLRPNKQEMRTNGPCLDVHGAVHSPTLADAPPCTEGGGPKHSVRGLAPVPGGSSVDICLHVCVSPGWFPPQWSD